MPKKMLYQWISFMLAITFLSGVVNSVGEIPSVVPFLNMEFDWQELGTVLNLFMWIYSAAFFLHVWWADHEDNRKEWRRIRSSFR